MYFYPNSADNRETPYTLVRIALQKESVLR